VYSQKATYHYIDTIVDVFTETARTVRHRKADESEDEGLCVYAHNSVAQVKVAIRTLAQWQPTQFVDIIEELSDKSVVRYNDTISCNTGTGNVEASYVAGARLVLKSRPFRRQMLKDHAKSLIELVSVDKYNCAFVVLTDEPCIEVLHVMKSMFSANGALGSASLKPSDIPTNDARLPWQQFGVNVFGCGSRQIRGRYFPRMSTAPDSPQLNDHERSHSDPCYLHRDGYELRRLRRSVHVRSNDWLASGPLPEGGKGTDMEAIQMFVWVLMHPRLRIVYYYCITVDPTPYPPILGWRVCEFSQRINFCFNQFSGLAPIASKRNRSGHGLGPAPLISVAADVDTVAATEPGSNASSETVLPLNHPTSIKVVSPTTYGTVTSSTVALSGMSPSRAQPGEQQGPLEVDDNHAAPLGNENFKVITDSAISASVDTVDDYDSNFERSRIIKGFPLFPEDFRPLLRPKHGKPNNGIDLNHRVLSRHRRKSEPATTSVPAAVPSILGSTEESLFYSSNYIIAQTAKRKNKMRNIQRPCMLTDDLEECSYHPRNAGNILNRAVVSFDDGFQESTTSAKMLNHCKILKSRFQREVP
jgi:hypothetical protein